MKYLLDTDISSEPTKPLPRPRILQQLHDHKNEIAIPAPVWHELRFGCSRLQPSRRREAIERYLQEVLLATFPILEYGWKEAEWHARERARLAAIGRMPPFVDGQIAAIAHENGLVLVTLNTRDFQLFAGLTLETWT